MSRRKLLRPDQKEELLQAMKKVKISREYRRIQAIYLYGTGEVTKKIAEITQLTPVTIYRLYTNYISHGLSSIPDAPREGRPSRLSAEQKAELKDMILNKTPAEVGFPANFNWTAKLVQEYILRAYKVSYSHKGITLILKSLNLSYTRPTYTLAKADSVKQEAFRKDFDRVKKLINEQRQHILFEDESMIRDYQAIGATWFERGKQRIIKTFGKHRGVKLVGCLDYESGDIYCEEHDTYNAQTFLYFFKNVLKRYSGKIVMILDNARIHHAKLIQPFLLQNIEAT